MLKEKDFYYDFNLIGALKKFQLSDKSNWDGKYYFNEDEDKWLNTSFTGQLGQEDRVYSIYDFKKDSRWLNDYWERQNKIDPNYNIVSNYALGFKEFHSWALFSGNYDDILRMPMLTVEDGEKIANILEKKDFRKDAAFQKVFNQYEEYMYELHKANNYTPYNRQEWMNEEPYYTIDFNVKFNGNLQLVENEWKANPYSKYVETSLGEQWKLRDKGDFATDNQAKNVFEMKHNEYMFSIFRLHIKKSKANLLGVKKLQDAFYNIQYWLRKAIDAYNLNGYTSLEEAKKDQIKYTNEIVKIALWLENQINNLNKNTNTIKR